jgi:hypothetical protein
MGWLKQVRNAEDRMVLDSHLKERTDWASWAATHGWTYQASAPELAGRYRPALTTGAERYDYLMTTTRNGMAVQAFQYADHVWDTRAHRGYGAIYGYVVIELPGRPPAQGLAQGAERTLQQMGGTLPHDSHLDLVDNLAVSTRQGGLRPDQLDADVELLTRQFAAVPATFWQ